MAASLDRFIKKFFFIKRPRLAVVWFSNGKKFGFQMVWTIRNPKFETFRFRMDSELECSEFEPRLYPEIERQKNICNIQWPPKYKSTIQMLRDSPVAEWFSISNGVQI